MFFWVRHILALSAAILLALPPGWCCFVPQQVEASDRPEAEQGCCRGCPTHADHGAAPDHKEAPAAPAPSCCPEG